MDVRDETELRETMGAQGSISRTPQPEGTSLASIWNFLTTIREALGATLEAEMRLVQAIDQMVLALEEEIALAKLEETTAYPQGNGYVDSAETLWRRKGAQKGELSGIRSEIRALRVEVERAREVQERGLAESQSICLENG